MFESFSGYCYFFFGYVIFTSVLSTFLDSFVEDLTKAIGAVKVLVLVVLASWSYLRPVKIELVQKSLPSQ